MSGKKIWQLPKAIGIAPEDMIFLSKGQDVGDDQSIEAGMLINEVAQKTIDILGPLAKGDPGPQGIQGPQGPQGSAGVSGSVGPKGDRGLKGDVGPQGEQGIQGPRGVQGDQVITVPAEFDDFFGV